MVSYYYLKKVLSSSMAFQDFNCSNLTDFPSVFHTLSLKAFSEAISFFENNSSKKKL